MKTSRAFHRFFRFGASSLAAGFAGTLLSSVAFAQQSTFKLDRLEVPGAPDDTLMIARPVTQPDPIFFAQIGLGYALNPLRTTNIVSLPNQRLLLTTPARGVVQDQLTFYTGVGFQVFNRFTVAAAFPFTPFQDGQNPAYPTSSISANNKTTVVTTDGPSAGDIRLDFRGIIARTNNERGALGASFSVFAPTGTNSNFGGDMKTSGMLSIQAEYTIPNVIKKLPITVLATTGFAFRPNSTINDPVNNSGLGIGDEWRWQLGAFMPFKDGKYRLGVTVQGQTGIERDTTLIGNTVFKTRNTPIEWNVEGRMKFGPSDHWWTGLGLGSFIVPGYGAPDFRAVALVGVYVPILDSAATSPDRKLALRQKWREEGRLDSDGDGIPDDIDACPMDPEDHLGSDPNDGCPLPPDRDGDGIPDQFDKCPDQPEDKDGVDDGDGCPEVDADNDGIPDTADACPKEPGKPSPDPKKNGCPIFISDSGTVLKISQQVHFATGSATILPDSFALLQEISDLLRANASIKRMSIEGHTDNRGGHDMNVTLSQNRANSVMAWITSHGVEAARLEAHGYGPDRPVDGDPKTNDTDKGRQANRRVEFKIVSREDTNAVKK